MDGQYEAHGGGASSSDFARPAAPPSSLPPGGRPLSVPPLAGPNPPLSFLGDHDDVTARPPRTHLAPLHPQALSAGQLGADASIAPTAISPSHAAATLSPIRGARPPASAMAAESPSKLQDDAGLDGAVVGSLAMVARRRRLSSQPNTNSPSRPLRSPEVERTEAYTQLYGHQPMPPEMSAGPVRPRGSISPEAAPAGRTDLTAFDLLDPDTDGSPTW